MTTNTYTFYPAAEVSWVVETGGIYLVNKAAGTALFLDYPRAAVWDLISRQYPPGKMTAMIMAIVSLANNEAEQLILECREQWLNDGLLVKEPVKD